MGVSLFLHGYANTSTRIVDMFHAVSFLAAIEGHNSIGLYEIKNGFSGKR